MISARGLRVRLGHRDILKGVDVDVPQSSLTGLIGPNGAGKTTLLRALSGTVPHDGAIRLEGQEVKHLTAKERARLLAMVQQDTHLDHPFTVRDLALIGRYAHVGRLGQYLATDYAVVDQVLKEVGIDRFADRRVTRLSGGERQLALLARALAQEAPVLLLDEATSNLDLGHQFRLLGTLRRLIDQGRTVLATIHDLPLAARVCDHLVLLQDGQVVASGTPAEVMTPERLESVFGIRARVVQDPEMGLRLDILGPAPAGKPSTGSPLLG